MLNFCPSQAWFKPWSRVFNKFQLKNPRIRSTDTETDVQLIIEYDQLIPKQMCN